MKNTQNEIDQPLVSADRRSFLKGAGMSGLAVASGALLVSEKAFAAQTAASVAPASGLTSTDIEVLNFALNLEYLEAEFYTKALTGLTLSESGVGTKGTGNAGPTIGGAQIDFSSYTDATGTTVEFSGKLKKIVTQITKDEQNHVKLLRMLLGNMAIAKPAINLDATEWKMNFKTFLNQARDFEDVGSSAYGGAATLLSTTALSYGARIALIEAYHASTLRLLVEENNVMSPAVDANDVPPPPTGTFYFPIQMVSDGNPLDLLSLAVVRTPSQVLAIVYANAMAGANYGGFFPRGMNGAITTV